MRLIILIIQVMRAVWKVRELTLLFRIRNLWRCGDGLFFEISLGKRCTSYNASPNSWKRAADRWSLRNFLPQSSLFMVGKAQKSHEARSGLYGGCSSGVPPIHFFQAEHRIQFRSRPMRFLGFFNHEKGAPMQEISKWSTACSTFSRSGWSVVRTASLAKGGTSKKRPLPHLHKFPTRSNKMSPRTLHTALVFCLKIDLTFLFTRVVDACAVNTLWKLSLYSMCNGRRQGQLRRWRRFLVLYVFSFHCFPRHNEHRIHLFLFVSSANMSLCWFDYTGFEMFILLSKKRVWKSEIIRLFELTPLY
jgi:hypothetical protein